MFGVDFSASQLAHSQSTIMASAQGPRLDHIIHIVAFYGRIEGFWADLVHIEDAKEFPILDLQARGPKSNETKPPSWTPQS